MLSSNFLRYNVFKCNCQSKKDLEEFKGVITYPICFGCISVPYIKEFKELTKKKEFKFQFEDFGCLQFEGHTYGCYGGYVNQIMKEKLGDNYYQNLLSEAKNQFVINLTENDSLISIYDLKTNEKPSLLGQKIELIDEGIMPRIRTNLPLIISDHNSLFLDLDFIVEKNGAVSNLKISNWVNQYPQYEQYKEQLSQIAFETLRYKYGIWNPGRYDGKVVRTKNILRVHFD